jgi:hypothetical protein
VYPFEARKWEMSGGLMNKKKDNNDAVFVDFVPTVYVTQSNFHHLSSLPGNPSDTRVATECAARTNPSRSYVDVPVFILELGDIAQLLRDTGRSLFKRGAHINLSYQFGIAPLVEDLVKLVDFMSQLQIRMKEIDRLKSKRGLRRTTAHGVYSRSDTDLKIAQSQGVNLTLTYKVSTQQIVRAHCRWIPTPAFSKLSAREVSWLVRRVMHGLELDFSTLWEGLPWTWIIDYCTTIGSYFKANRNIIPATILNGKVSVMRHTTSRWHHQGFNGVSTRTQPVNILYETKTRVNVVVSPTAHLPFLSGNQLGILSSLAILKIWKG